MVTKDDSSQTRISVISPVLSANLRRWHVGHKGLAHQSYGQQPDMWVARILAVFVGLLRAANLACGGLGMLSRHIA